MGKAKLDPKKTNAVMIKAGLKPLEPYKNVHSKWKSIHIECGKIVYPSYIRIKSGQSGCKECADKKSTVKRRNSSKKIMEVMKKAKLKPLEPYKNTHAKWKCKCLGCKKIVYRRFNDVLASQSGCQYCSKRLVDENHAIKIMLKKKLKPLVPYKSNKTKWKSKCLVCERIVYPTYNSVQKSGGCKYCAGKVVSQAQAKRLFIKAKLMPLEPYKKSDTKWKSKCLICGEIVYPTYGNIYMGHGGCFYCSDIGFKPQKPAILYLISHKQMNAIKVGITNTETKISRLNQFKRQGWLVDKKYPFKKGIHASKIENEIIRWLKKDLRLTNYLSSAEMPITGGHSETFDADLITTIEMQKKIKELIKGYRNNP